MIPSSRSALLPGIALAAALLASGCGTPGAPMPPSLNLPSPVADLSATRTGNQVALTWTMPKRTTDRLPLKASLAVRVCRKQGDSPCEQVATTAPLAPGADGSFNETLPPALASGPVRSLAYFVEVLNRNGRSAGPSNAAATLAGDPPPPIADLTAEVRRQGILLRWTPSPADAPPTAVRLHRALLTPPEDKPRQGPLAPPSEPAERTLLVEADPPAVAPDRALDKDIRLGAIYQYRAQRVARVQVDGQAMELPGVLSAPLRVEAADIFPPETPAALAAVANPAQAGQQPSIDLSWQPVPDPALAGYAVYRRLGTSPDWQRISPPEPIVPPAFRDLQVQSGQTYRYAVTAIGRNGHQSPRSAEAEETVPNP